VRPGAISRRQFVTGAGATGLGLLAGCGRLPWLPQAPSQETQGDGERARIVGLLTSALSPSTVGLDAFRRTLSELGYVEGQNVLLTWAVAGSDENHLREQAAELLRLGVDLVVADGTAATQAAAAATAPMRRTDAAVPVVSILGINLTQMPNDLLLRTYRRTNVTGTTRSVHQGLSGKRLELLSYMIGGLPRVGVLWDVNAPQEFRETQTASRALGLPIVSLDLHDTSDLDQAFEAAIQAGVEALLPLDQDLILSHRSRVLEFAGNARLPGMFPNRGWVENGGLVSYGPNHTDAYRHAAYYVDRLLRGAKPADLPVEQPMRYDFVVNLKTAQALGITFPNEIMLQVTEVIDQ
jgi:putative ABC transport system substrate-binding protein